jgi:hypothetical protein
MLQARGGGASGRSAREIADVLAASTGSSEFSVIIGSAGRGRTPAPVASAMNAAALRPHAVRIRHVVRSLCVWCIGQVCPGLTALQHAFVEGAAACASSAQHRASGAAIRPASWHTSQPAAMWRKSRRTERMEYSVYALTW